MNYENTREARFLSRPNRFTAIVEMEGVEEMVHVKNTGRCRELLREGARVILEEAGNPARKTKYSLIAVYKGNALVNMDSQAPNAAAAEAVLEGRIPELLHVDFLRREAVYSHSRFDIYYERAGEKGARVRRGFVEVKGVTLEEDGTAMFPDAPTERGARHLRELVQAKREGYEAAALFVIQMEGVRVFRPNERTDPAFAEALREARREGVMVLAYACHVEPGAMRLTHAVPVDLGCAE